VKVSYARKIRGYEAKYEAEAYSILVANKDSHIDGGYNGGRGEGKSN
jgi:hypothetical protein